MNKKRKKSIKIAVYLIKDDVEYDKILKSNVEKLPLIENGTSITYYSPTKLNVPKWLDSYFNLKDINLKDDFDIINANAKVISLHRLTIEGEERVFAIPFGNGKYLLNDDVIEEQFGLKILLNSVTRDGFRQLIASNYGGDHRTKTIQTPKKTDISEFGFDIHNDFLRKATAKSDDELFNKNTIVGGDLLNVSVPVNYETINDFLKECYYRYKSDEYKEDYGWLDNIKEVKEKSIKNELDQELIKIINRKEFSRVWAAIPEIICWENILDFRFGKAQKGYDDIEIENIIELFPNGIVPNTDFLKNKRIYAMSLDGEEVYNWKIYNCIIAEIDYKDNVYCLNFGKWYKVSHDYVNLVKEYYNQIPIYNIDFPYANGEREEKYNEKLNKCFKNSILLDRKNVKTSEMNSSVEVCDVLTDNNELIHVKKNGGSSYLSHLFNQAVVSGTLLFDVDFRNEVNRKIQKTIFPTNFNSNEYTIILAIITNKNSDRPKIPFFSQVAIRYAIETLQKMGYEVKIKNIYNINNIERKK